MKKKIYLKSWLESLLMTITALCICFWATTIDSIGNSIYNKIFIITIIISLINIKVLTKYGKTFQEEN